MLSTTADRDRLREITDFPSLVEYLRDDLHWPIEPVDFEDLTFDYTPQELGIDPATAAHIKEIKQLRPLATGQPWGIFFLQFEPKRLPVVVLRKILARLVVKKRAVLDPNDRKVWNLHDLLFISNYGNDDERQITFAHFTQDEAHADLPELKVLGWDEKDTALHIDHAIAELKSNLVWKDGEAVDDWRRRWAAAFRLRPKQVIQTSKQLAIRLAALAREIRAKCLHSMSVETEHGPLKTLLAGFKQALIHDLDEPKFADLYAQTISYGLLSMAIRRTVPGEGHAIVVDNLVDLVNSGNPFLKDLLTQFLNVGGRRWNDDAGRLIGIDFDELGVNDVVDTLRQADMEAVLADFGNRNPTEDPVIHFYELFLKEYDAKMRTQRGVFYTPRPVVSYIVRSVHELLQTDFGLPDGLADTTTWAEMLQKHNGLKMPEVEHVDPATRKTSMRPIDPATPFVQILDPATGTATFLVEVIDVIHKHMVAKWRTEGVEPLWINPRWTEYVSTHLLPRLYGYELMMAPYAIAHMKISLKLFETGCTLGPNDRARVYLTNALEPARHLSDTFAQMAPALAHEGLAVSEVKQQQQFTVVIGNPPYSKMSANLEPEAVRLIEPFRYVDGTLIVERGALAHELNLQDDYVKFFGLLFKVLSKTGVGIGGFITNFRYIDSPSLRGLRHLALTTFNRIAVTNLGGQVSDRDSVRQTDENVFDIEQGVAISVLSRTMAPSAPLKPINYGRVFGDRLQKYDLLASNTSRTLSDQVVIPSEPFYPLRPASGDAETEFRSWDGLESVMPMNSGCVITSRDKLAIAFTPDELLATVSRFAHSPTGDLAIQREIGFSVKAKWDVEACKRLILRLGIKSDFVRPILYRPFDVRYIYYVPQLLDTPSRPVSDVLAGRENLSLLTPKVKTTAEFCHVLITRDTAEKKVCSHDRATQMFPLWRHRLGGVPLPNVQETRYRDGKTVDTPQSTLAYAYAVLHSPGYRTRYGVVLRDVFPRLPRPRTASLFDALSRFGDELIAYHLFESPRLRDAPLTYTGRANPTIGDVTYEGSRVRLSPQGEDTFSDVSQAVWNFRIGGYQVCEKWLKDRKGRTLSAEDVVHYQKIVTVLGETIRLMAEIDEKIDSQGGWPGAFVIAPPTTA